ncbi:hypothetical protein GF406_06410 [candidate division KSB1 bacterium]|nr:hypothetical protein [candidate division KSB1 bacterium]
MPHYKDSASDPKDHSTYTDGDKSDSLNMVPFIPIQHWFADLNLQHPSHFNQAMMLEKKTKFKIQYIKNIFTRLLKHHDALRAIWCGSDRHLTIQSTNGFDLDFEFTDISHLPEDKIEREIDTQATKRHSGIDLENGPLWNLSLIRTATGDYLLIIIHHLYGYLPLHEIESAHPGAACFDTVYIHSNALAPHIEPVCIPVERPTNEPITKATFPLALEIISNDNISFDITYNTGSYTQSDIEKLYSRFIETLELWLKDPGISIDFASEPIPVKSASPIHRTRQNEILDTLLKLWKVSLKKPEINEYDDFFELGGDSLAATEMIAEINRLFPLTCH